MKPASQNWKALSVAQPWAECIVKHGKNVENRSWNTYYRGYFAIHASRSCDLDRFEWCQEEYRIRIDPESVPYGAILGFAELTEVITEDTLSRNAQKWFRGTHGLVLANVIRLKKPVPAKGTLSFWNIDARAMKQIRVRLTRAQLKRIEGCLLSKNFL